MMSLRAWFGCAIVTFAPLHTSADTPDALSASDYQRAERFLSWNAEKGVLNGTVRHRWIDGSDSFWYRRQTSQGHEFLVVDAASGAKRPAFDHELLAAALSKASGAGVDPKRLPFNEFEFSSDRRRVEFSVDAARWQCDIAKRRACEAVAARPNEPVGLESPDGRWIVFRKGHDLWLHARADGRQRPLTTDGEERWSYGALAGTSGGWEALGFNNRPRVPVALWSPDSKRLLTHRMDERGVLDLHLTRHAPPDGVRPQHYTVPYAMPGDERKPTAALIVFDIDAGARHDMKFAPLAVPMTGPLELGHAWWTADSKQVHVVPMEEGEQRLQYLAMDAADGAVKVLFEETSPTYLQIGRGLQLGPLPNGDIVWYSERSGWGHLYLYDARGRLIRALTSGEWKVDGIERLDARSGLVYFTAVGREAGEDPYQRHLYSVSLQGGPVRLLTPENANHQFVAAASPLQVALDASMPSADRASFSPSGRFFLDSYSRPDLPSKTVLRSVRGKVIAVLEEADASPLQRAGLVLPQPFRVLAADGRTSLYGTLYRPSNFDASKRYPVIENLYPGPQSTVTPKSFMGALFDWDQAQAIAELGFIVVHLDGRGTPHRSKAFHDVSYKDMGQAGNLDDHIAGLKQLAQRRPWMDLERVGVYGHSGGGFAAARAILAYPDFYKVAVASSGNHDQRGYLLVWGPTYQGRYEGDSYDSQINARLADNLRGRLLLAHGEMDDNVPMALTLQLVDALVRANKDFDLLILPNADHTFDNVAPYFTRIRWDYFVRNLKHKAPPENYAIATSNR